MQKLPKKHYVYVLISNVEEKFYIGVRSCSCGIDEDSYMGSSSVMTKEDKSNCDKLVLKEFDTRKEAIAYEVELHNQFDVSINEKFWNKAKQTSTGFDTTGRVYSDEERAAHSKRMQGHKGARTWLGKKLPLETRRKISEANKGKSKSEEHVEALKASHAVRVYHQYDDTKYMFTHSEHGKVVCTQYELVKSYPELCKGNINSVIKGKRKTHKGWRIINE